MNEPEDNVNSDPKPETEPPSKRRIKRPVEIGGRKGLEPTRYGDWEKDGRAIDF